MKKNNPINNAELQMESQRLYPAVARSSGTDESKLTIIFAIILPCEIYCYSPILYSICGADLYTSLKRIFWKCRKTIKTHFLSFY